MLKGNKMSWALTAAAGLIVVYAVIASFLPEQRHHLERIEEEALGEPKMEHAITGRRTDTPLREEATNVEVLESAAGKSEEPFPFENLETQLTFAPTPLEKDQLRFDGDLTGGYEPQVLRPENLGQYQSPVFRTRPSPSKKPKEEKKAETGKPELVVKPNSVGWGKPQKAVVQAGGVLTAILRSDVVTGSGETLALVEVIGDHGGSLGICLMRASLERNRIQLEGSEIVGEDGSIRGKFAAFGPDGSQGLVGDSRKHVLSHFGIVLYRTALGVLALRVADGDNTLAGLVGANAGTQILGDLAGDQRRERGIPKTVVIARGFQFQLVALNQAVVSGSEAFTEASQPQFFGADRRRDPDKNQRLQALREYFQTNDKGFQQALNNPEYLLNLGDR